MSLPRRPNEDGGNGLRPLDGNPDQLERILVQTSNAIDHSVVQGVLHQRNPRGYNLQHLLERPTDGGDHSLSPRPSAPHALPGCRLLAALFC